MPRRENPIPPTLLECVINVSEGRDRHILDSLSEAAGGTLLDLHADADHGRSVLTLAAEIPALEAAVRRVVATAVARIDISNHEGVHPRLGAVDVVPFVPLPRAEHRTGSASVGDSGADIGSSADPGLGPAVEARDRTARWAAEELGVPAFLYGPLPSRTPPVERSLPDVRRGAFGAFDPDFGPPRPHPSAGALAVGARPVMVAYNLWLSGVGLEVARAVATLIRGGVVRSLAFDVGGSPQVSCNLLAPLTTGPDAVYDAVAARVGRAGGDVVRAELVGLAPAGVLARIPEARREQLDLSPQSTIEHRLEAAGIRKR